MKKNPGRKARRSRVVLLYGPHARARKRQHKGSAKAKDRTLNVSSAHAIARRARRLRRLRP